MSRFNALTVFKLENPAAVTANNLKKFAFQPPLSGEACACGWVSMEDLTDTKWKRSVPEIGEFMAFTLRIDTRKVAAPVLKLHLQEAMQKELEKVEAEGKTFVSRARKNELKEIITSKLLSKVEAAPTVVDVALDTSTGLLYVGSTSKGVLDVFTEHFAKSFGEEPMLLPYVLLGDNAGESEIFEGTGRVMRWIYDQSQVVKHDGHIFSVQMSEAASVSLAGTGALSVNSKGTLESANAALGEGLQIVKLHMEMEEDGVPESLCSLTWNRNFSLSGLKLPVATTADDDPDAAFLEKMYLVSRVVGVMSELFVR